MPTLIQYELCFYVIIIIIVDFIQSHNKVKNKVCVRRYAATSEKATWGKYEVRKGSQKNRKSC